MARQSRLARAIASILTLPITIAIVLFAVSNRQLVDLHFWPLPDSLEVPVYSVGLLTMLAGFLIGGVVAWFSALETRQRARTAERKLQQALENSLSDTRGETARTTAISPPNNA